MSTTPQYYIYQQQFNLFVQDFILNQEQHKQGDINQFIEEIKILERYSMDHKRIFLLFDHANFFPLYFSANIEKEYGRSVEYILNQGLLLWFKLIHWKQLSFAYKVNIWGPRFQKLVGKHIPLYHYDICICGLKIRDKWKQWRTFILKQKILTVTKNHKPLLSFIEAEEITSIYKADFIWYRPTCLYEGIQTTRAYFTSGAKKEYADILTPRELDILKLANQEISNQEISTLLGISKNTVERHRKNMIARVGVKDMTALLRIALIVKLI